MKPFLRYSFVVCLAGCTTADTAPLASPERDDVATGLAGAYDACLAKPVYRRDACSPGLVCNVAPGTQAGTCARVGAVLDHCDLTFGDLDCAAGLTCVAQPGTTAGAFCRGDGKGPCRAQNRGADCAAGYACADGADPLHPGSCQPVGSAGTPCDTTVLVNVCIAGLECVASARDPNTGTCLPKGRSGQHCAQSTDCDAGLVCFNAVCGPSGRCNNSADCPASMYCETVLGVCSASGTDGDGCQHSGGRPCAPGLICVGAGEYGTCVGAH
jgi:hypothetical protein